jgi:UDP:flavonoid glycosyltransferase YjiC (YdhE family)
MKFLIIPSNNSLSHIAKGIALRDSLIRKNHESLIAVGRHHTKFIDAVLDEYAILPDIQEIDGSPFPTLYWFKYPEKIVSCVNGEVDLIRRYRPEAVIGIFRYTAKVSSFFTGTPYYSLICGCMLPENREPLGFLKDDPGYATQQFYLDNFNKYSTVKMNRALKTLGAVPINSIKELLKGIKTFLWDFPEFMPLESGEDVIHAGPISWDKWPYDDYDLGSFMNIPLPLAAVAFGTGIEQKSVTRRIATLLVDSGYKVIIANGGIGSPSRNNEFGHHCLALNFAPLQEILNHASVLISHGGQMTVFEALRKKVPVVVMPFQPEQDHNGLCLERVSCGARLISHTPFSGNSRVYIDALDRLSDKDIASKIERVAKEKMIQDGLSKISLSMAGYLGVETITANLKVS